VEYASKAIEKSGTAIGIRCADGVVLGVEKAIVSRMILNESNRRIYTVGIHNGIVIFDDISLVAALRSNTFMMIQALSGFAADARQIVNRGREEATSYKGYYASAIPGSTLANRLAGFVHLHTLYWYYRPFGCSVLIGSYNPEGEPELHQIDPSGVCHGYYAAVVGKNKEAAKSELEKIDFRTYKCRDAVKEIARM